MIMIQSGANDVHCKMMCRNHWVANAKIMSYIDIC